MPAGATGVRAPFTGPDAQWAKIGLVPFVGRRVGGMGVGIVKEDRVLVLGLFWWVPMMIPVAIEHYAWRDSNPQPADP